MSLTAGVEVGSSELEMWLEELAMDPWARGFCVGGWDAPRPMRQDFSVVVIGAGMGGLNAAVHLKRAGIPFTVLEKNSSVGGTWYENRYPGRPGRFAQPDLHPRLRRQFHISVPLLPPGREREVLQLGRGHLRPAKPHRVPHRGAVDRVGRRTPSCGRSRPISPTAGACGEPTR